MSNLIDKKPDLIITGQMLSLAKIGTIKAIKNKRISMIRVFDQNDSIVDYTPDSPNRYLTFKDSDYMYTSNPGDNMMTDHHWLSFNGMEDRVELCYDASLIDSTVFIYFGEQIPLKPLKYRDLMGLIC